MNRNIYGKRSIYIFYKRRSGRCLLKSNRTGSKTDTPRAESRRDENINSLSRSRDFRECLEFGTLTSRAEPSPRAFSLPVRKQTYFITWCLQLLLNRLISSLFDWHFSNFLMQIFFLTKQRKFLNWW